MADIATELQTHFETFVDMWYNSGPIKSPGNPLYYDRTLDTFYGSSGTDNLAGSYSVTATDDGFYGDAFIIVDSSSLHGYYKDSVDYVFNRSWKLGIHGTIPTGGQTTPPKQMMDKWFKEFKATIPYYIRKWGL